MLIESITKILSTLEIWLLEHLCVFKGPRERVFSWPWTKVFLCPCPCLSSVAQSCPTLCNPMECSMRSFSVHRQLMELVQIHVHQISDAIQPSHPLLSPFFSCLQSWPASESFPMVWFPYCPKDSQESSTPQFKSINSSAFSFLYSPTLHTLLICFLICI